MNDLTISDLLVQASINTENILIAFSYFSCQDFSDPGRSTGANIVFYQGVTIDHGTNVPELVAQSSA